MNVSISNPQQIMRHVLMGNRELVDTVVNTPEWKELNQLNGELTINGVTASAQVLEDALQHVVKRIEEYYAKQYDADAFDERVEEKAKQLLKEHAGNAIEILDELSNKLQEADDLLVPHWERK